MVTAKLAFVLIQVGSNLWVNPMQVTAITPCFDQGGLAATCVLTTGEISFLNRSDWPIEKVREALAPAVVAKAMEAAR